MSRWLWWVVGITAFLFFDALFCAGMIRGSWIGSLPLYLAFGWVLFLVRVLPEVSVDPSGVATAVACLVLLVVGVHWLGRWWGRNVGEPRAEGAVAQGAVAEGVSDDERRAGPSPPAHLPRERGVSFAPPIPAPREMGASFEPPIPVPRERGVSDRGEPWWSVRRTMVVVGGILLMFVAGLSGTAMVHQVAWLVTSPEPITNQAREMVYRTQSRNNLKLMGLAVHNYHDVNGLLPPGGVFDEAGRGLHSWQTVLLPYVEQRNLFNLLDLTRPWNHPRNADVVGTRVSMFENPGVRRSTESDALEPAPSHYAGNSHVFGADRGMSWEMMSDGNSNTILIGEVNAEIKSWADPTNVRDLVLGINKSPDGFGGPWHGGAQFVLGDGATRFLSEEIDPKVLKALATPAAGDDASGDW